MRIVSLRAENVKRLKAVEITPDGNVVIIEDGSVVGAEVAASATATDEWGDV